MINYTIITPHYRDVDGLKRLEKSIPNRSDIQFIIVDDNSYDDFDFEEMIRSFNRKNVELYFNSSDTKGAGGSRNVGLKHAQGKWLIFADADDYFVEGAFDVFDRYLNTDADIIYFSPTSIDLETGQLAKRHIKYEKYIKAYMENPIFRDMWLRYKFTSPWSKMIRREIVERNGIQFENIRWSNDVMFVCKCGYFAKTIDAFMDNVYCITYQKGTLTTAVSEESYKVRIDVFIRQYLFLCSVLKRKEVDWLIGWPAFKLYNAFRDGFGLRMAMYIYEEFKKHNINIFRFNLVFLKRFIKRKILHNVY